MSSVNRTLRVDDNPPKEMVLEWCRNLIAICASTEWRGVNGETINIPPVGSDAKRESECLQLEQRAPRKINCFKRDGELN
ncbi:hypothetical protein ZHAS_00002764 [Anopheles sinensis]|uniref:Uncharacterized protein n=1 Tax=Anopheles sinensis TaxID=74873 RepID=A0A084VCY8_ANOSI|nr:hypothetical protein ZHAS_00002764 [Anopheles sinensis]